MSTTSVGTSLTAIALVPARFSNLITFQIINGATALNAFQVQARNAGGDTPWVTLQSTDPTTNPGWGIRATANLVTLASSGNAMLSIPGGFFEIRLMSSVASGTSDVTVYGSAL